ncbi:hypothetical protein AMTRI_Chr03g50760 [Amborella trichopoda]
MKPSHTIYLSLQTLHPQRFSNQCLHIHQENHHHGDYHKQHNCNNQDWHNHYHYHHQDYYHPDCQHQDYHNHHNYHNHDYHHHHNYKHKDYHLNYHYQNYHHPCHHDCYHHYPNTVLNSHYPNTVSNPHPNSTLSGFQSTRITQLYQTQHPLGPSTRSPWARTTLFPVRTQAQSSHFRHSPKLLSPAVQAVLQSRGLQHPFKDWHHLRFFKLTASTFAFAVGFWPRRRVQLWLEKLGFIHPLGNLATCWSNIQEHVALERYHLITGNQVSFVGFERAHDPSEDWLGASPDGLVGQVAQLSGGGVLEIKCPFFSGKLEHAGPWFRVPMCYVPQAQGLLEIVDREWMDFYVWTPNGSSLFRVWRDREYWALLKGALADFWWKHVIPAREMCEKEGSAEDVRALRPASRHELCDLIVAASTKLSWEAKLLVREIHGKLRC